MSIFNKSPLLLCLFSVLFLTGCQTLRKLEIVNRDNIEKEIVAARAETEKKLEELRKRETESLREIILKHQIREQSASDYLFKGNVVFSGLNPDSVSRPTLIMGHSIQQTAAQLPPATPEAQSVAFKAIQLELDETKVTTQALREKYEKELGMAKAEGEQKTKAIAELETKVKDIEIEKTTVLNIALKKEQDLQAAKDKIQDKDLAESERERLAAEESEKLKRWLMAALGVIALASGAAAVFVPIPAVKQYGLIVAVIAGGLVVAIPFIKPIHVLVTILVVVIGAGLLLVKSYNKEARVATGVVRAIQEVKVNSNEEYQKILKPKLEEWLTVYDPKTGKAIPDTEAIKHIDDKLKEVGDK